MKDNQKDESAINRTIDSATQKSIDEVINQLENDHTTSTLIESFAEAFLVINQSGTIMQVNQRFSELFGYKRKDIIGRKLETIIPERFRHIHTKHTSNYFNSPHVRPMGRGMELKGLKEDGSEFPVEVSISYLQNNSEKLGMAFITDITARAEAEQELQRQNRALSDFAQTVAHDLKSLISVLTSSSELLELEYENLLPADRQLILSSFKDASYKMNDIINELLFLARAKREEVELKNIDLKKATQEALQRLQQKIKATGAEVIVEDLNDNILGHQPWIEEVIYNLVSNALNHGGDQLTIRIDTQSQENGMTRVRIIDNGNGMTEEQLQVLLERPEDLPYSWVKGHGLGLSIVHHVLDKLGSSLEIQCSRNEGCCFSFLLPVSK